LDPDDAWLERMLAEQSSDSDDRVVRLLEEVKEELAALRRDLRTDRPYVPGLAELRHDVASLTIRLGVVFHQLCLKIDGRPLTIAPGAFEDETAAAARKR
jgi:hypothetical protein